jgi:hypothetical protein
MTTTVSMKIACANCHSTFGRRVEDDNWRQRSATFPGSSRLYSAYLCGICAAGFSSEEAIDGFLDAVLDELNDCRASTG